MLQEAVAAGAQIIAILPACAREDASRLHDMLGEIGAHHARVEIVDSAATARSILEQALAPVPEPTANGTQNGGLFWKVPALLASGAAMALGAFIAGNQWLPPLIPHGARGIAAPRITKIEPPPEAKPVLPGDDTHPAENNIPAHSPPDVPPRQDILPFKPPEPPSQQAERAAPDRAAVHSDSEAKSGIASQPDPPPVPVKLQELRAENNGSCAPFIIERRTPPRAIDVALDAADRFHDSAGRNLCGLEWSLTPEAAQSGVQGFDIVDLAADRYGALLDRTGAPGASTKIRIEFTRDLEFDVFRRLRNSNPIIYNVKLKFAGAPAPEQVQQFRHAIR
jgi:hypothetical protein